ncbi:MAG: hypothetical protein U1D67_01540 [Dehalococcoidia bacterium]|nr:hypothetical protein [Dehalococcoidia bacterium]
MELRNSQGGVICRSLEPINVQAKKEAAWRGEVFLFDDFRQEVIARYARNTLGIVEETEDKTPYDWPSLNK